MAIWAVFKSEGWAQSPKKMITKENNKSILFFI